MTDLRPTLLFYTYRAVTGVLEPLAFRNVRKNLTAANVAPERQLERRGIASQPRPEGQLIWFHGASVGETLSVLTLIQSLGQALPKSHFLITSGTATSAELVAKRLPPRTQHQFAPLDAAKSVSRFLSHWRPDAGIFVESELWPNILTAANAQHIPLALLNARLSEKSARDWGKFPDTARFILDQFAIYIAQNSQAGALLRQIGANSDRLAIGTNLKSASAPLPIDDNALLWAKTQLNGRLLWMVSSTHKGEEQIVFEAHKSMLGTHPDLCLWLAPRHPERGDEIENLAKSTGFAVARRTRDEPIGASQVYLADTLGEVGTWYALSPIVVMGGAFEDLGGHNPIEPAQAGAAIVSGPHTRNFSETYAPMETIGAVERAQSPQDIAKLVGTWLDNPEALATAQSAAKSYVEKQSKGLERVVEMLISGLDLK